MGPGPGILETIQFAHGRFDSALCAFGVGHRFAPVGYRLLFHRGCGGLRRPILCSSSGWRPHRSTLSQAGPPPTFPSLDTCSLAQNFALPLLDRSTIVSAQERDLRRQFLLRNLCTCRHLRVSNSSSFGKHARCADAPSLLFGVAYWFVWTIVLPRYRGYRLEEEADILGDGTTITKLVRKDI